MMFPRMSLLLLSPYLRYCHQTHHNFLHQHHRNINININMVRIFGFHLGTFHVRKPLRRLGRILTCSVLPEAPWEEFQGAEVQEGSCRTKVRMDMRYTTPLCAPLKIPKDVDEETLAFIMARHSSPWRASAECPLPSPRAAAPALTHPHLLHEPRGGRRCPTACISSSLRTWMRKRSNCPQHGYRRRHLEVVSSAPQNFQHRHQDTILIISSTPGSYGSHLWRSRLGLTCSPPPAVSPKQHQQHPHHQHQHQFTCTALFASRCAILAHPEPEWKDLDGAMVQEGSRRTKARICKRIPDVKRSVRIRRRALAAVHLYLVIAIVRCMIHILVLLLRLTCACARTCSSAVWSLPCILVGHGLSCSARLLAYSSAGSPQRSADLTLPAPLERFYYPHSGPQWTPRDKQGCSSADKQRIMRHHHRSRLFSRNTSH